MEISLAYWRTRERAETERRTGILFRWSILTATCGFALRGRGVFHGLASNSSASPAAFENATRARAAAALRSLG